MILAVISTITSCTNIDATQVNTIEIISIGTNTTINFSVGNTSFTIVILGGDLPTICQATRCWGVVFT